MTSKNKSKSTWRIIKSELNGSLKTSDNISILQNNYIISDPKLVANILNDFFINPVDSIIGPNIQSSQNCNVYIAETKYHSPIILNLK